MFKLDPRLEKDTVVIGDFTMSRLLLAKDSRYPWCILVPKRSDITELYQLTATEQAQVNLESAWLGQQLMSAFSGDSLNVASLGNVVSQLHIHHVVRFKTDETWPIPIWGVGVAIPYDQETLNRHQAQISELMANQLGFVSAV